MLSAIDTHYPALNFVSREHLDPLFWGIMKLFGLWDSQFIYVTLQTIVWFLGFLYLYYTLVSKDRTTGRAITAVVWGICAVLVLSAVVDVDPFINRAHWFPWFLSALFRLRKTPSILNFIGALVISFEWCISAGAFAPLGTLFAALGAYWLSSTDLEKGVVLGTPARGAWCFPLVFFASFVASVAIYPVYPMPDFPAGARLAPISVLTFEPRPLLGSWLEPNPMIYSEFSRQCGVFARRLAFFSLCFLLLEFVRGVWRERKAKVEQLSRTPVLAVGSSLILACTVIVLLMEGVLESDYRLLSVFQMFRLTIPGVGLVALPWLLVPVAVTLAFAGSMRKTRVLFPALLFWLVVAVRLGGFLAADIEYVNHFIKAANLARSDSFSEKLQSSPSAFVIRHKGSWSSIKNVGAEREFERLTRVSLLSDIESGPNAPDGSIKQGLSLSVKAAPMNEEAKFAVDGQAETRWRTSGPQRSGEFLELAFNQTVTAIKVVLSIRKTPTDFPRGIRVDTSMDGQQYTTVLNEPTWHGSLRWTPAGYPYFGPQSEVVLDLPRTAEFKFLRFTQLGKSSQFDWSIGEVKLYSTP